MKITKLKITSFGALVDREIVLSDGINLIGGANEAGKTSLAMFIKFVLYGLSARGTEQFPMGEKKRFINWSTGRAAGSMEFEADGKTYRIERVCAQTGNGDAVRETVTCVDAESGGILKLSAEPGEYFLGVPESVFVNTVFVRQVGGTGVDASAVSTAISNMLGSADEKIGAAAALKKLEKLRVALIHKNSVGGEIRDLEREIAAEETALAEAEKQSGEVIAAQAGLAKDLAEIDEAEAQIEHAKLVTGLYEDIRALGDRENMRSLAKECAAAKAEFESAKDALPGREVRGSLAEAKASLALARDQVKERADALEATPEPVEAEASAEECDEAISAAEAYSAAAGSKRLPSLILAVLGALAIAAGAAVYLLKLAPPIAAIVLGAVALILFGASAAVALSAGSDKKALREMCGEWDAEDPSLLVKRIRQVRSQATAAEQAALLRGAAADELMLSRERLSDREAEVLSVCAGFGSGCADPDDAIRECEAMIDEAENAYAEARERFSDLAAKCRAEEEKLSVYDFDAIKLRRNEYEFTPDWDEAQALDAEGYGRAVFGISFNEKKILALKDKIGDHRETLAARQGRTPAQIGENLAALRASLEEKKLRSEAIILAIDTITGAGENIRREIVPKMTAEASRVFAAATGGKYPGLGIDSAFAMTCESPEGTHSADYLSAGSADAAYISLRLALASVLFKKEAPPMIFDESFGKIDEERTDALLGVLSCTESQSLVFTCRESDLTRAAKVLGGSANVIGL